MAGKTIVMTGTLSIPRNEMKERILAAGAKVSGSISGKTDYLLNLADTKTEKLNALVNLLDQWEEEVDSTGLAFEDVPKPRKSKK